MPVPEQQASQGQGMQTANNPAQEYIRGSVNNSLGEPLDLETTRNLTKKSALCTFTDFKPAKDSLVTSGFTDIGVTLKVVDTNPENREKLGSIRIGRMLVDGNDVTGSVSENGDGFRISLPGYALNYSGTHSVMVTLLDEQDSYYAIDWVFMHETDLPRYTGIGPAIDSTGFGDIRVIGYSVLLDQPLKVYQYEVFSNPDYWTITDKKTGAELGFESVRPALNLQNEVVLISSAATPDTSNIEVNFTPDDIEGYDFRELVINKATSWLELENPNCHDCDPVTGDPGDPGIGENGLDILENYDPDAIIPNPESCCNPAICYVIRSHPYQCCHASVIPIYSGPCNTCSDIIVWRRNAVDRPDPAPGQDWEEIAGTFWPSHVDPHPDAPAVFEPGGECPYDECGPNSFVDHRGDPQCDMPAPTVPVDETGGWVLHSMTSLGASSGVYFRPDWTADYIVQIGTFKFSLALGWQWCTGWQYPESGVLHIDGDHDNPIIETEIIPGSQMRQELDLIQALKDSDPATYGHILCDRYYGNDFAQMNSIVAEYEQGCGKILKVRVKDKCISGHRERPFIDVDGEDRMTWGLDYWICNAAVFDEPDYYGLYGDEINPLWWHAPYNLEPAYHCDYTDYQDCYYEYAEDVDQERIYYYLINRDIEPFPQWLIGGTPYANDLGNPPEVIYESCDMYFAFPKKDHLGSAYQDNKGCGINRISPQVSWLKEAILLTQEPDNSPIDPNLHFYMEEYPGNGGCRLHPYTEDNQGPDGYLRPTTVAEINSEGRFFAVFYEAERDYSTYGSDISRPRLIIDYADESEPNSSSFPELECNGLDVNTCTFYNTGVWTFGCMHPAFDELGVYAYEFCNIEHPQKSTSAEGGEDPNYTVAAENVKKGTVIKSVKDLFDYYDNDIILEHPFVSGTEEYEADIMIGRGPCDYQDGPTHFAKAIFSCCMKPIDLEIYLKITTVNKNWETIENSLGQNSGNAFEEQDAKDAGYTGWRDPAFIYQEKPLNSYPAVFFKQGNVDPTPYLHNDLPDIVNPNIGRDDLDNDIVHLNQNGFEVFTDPECGQPIIDSEDYIFTVGWDGRQWLLDKGIDVDVIQPDLGDGGARMYPPGKYTMYVWGRFISDDGLTIYEDLKDIGEIYLVYGDWLYDGDCRYRSVIWSEGLADNLPYARGKLRDRDRYAYLFGTRPGNNGPYPEIVTLLTGKVYTPLVSHNGEDRSWKALDNNPTLLIHDLVLLNECDSCTDSEYNYFSYRSFIGWHCKVDDLYSSYWERAFYYYLTKNPNENSVDDAWKYARGKVRFEPFPLDYRNWHYQYDLSLAGKRYMVPCKRGIGLADKLCDFEQYH